MYPLYVEPQDKDFVPLSEYQSSTPTSFSLDEVPVLWLVTELNDDRRCWVASNGVHLWSATEKKGSQIGYSDISFIGIAQSDVLVQLDGGELLRLRAVNPRRLYEALTACWDRASLYTGDELGAFDADASLGSLESGNADDLGAETVDGPAASVSVEIERRQILGKRPRE